MHFHLPKPLHGWREFAGEVGIIVIGVLIALGAEQMVEAVHARNQEHQRLERLFEESRTDVTQLRTMRDALGRMTQRETAFAFSLSHGFCPAEELWDAPVTVNLYPAIAAPTSVYDEVVGAGGLASIKSAEARTAVAEFHAMLQWTASQTDFFRSNRTPPVRLDDPRVTLRFEPHGQDPEVFSFDRAALCSDHGFRNRMIDSVRDHETNYKYRSRLTDRALRMCGTLGHVLGKECTPSDGASLSEADRHVAAGTAKSSI